MLKFSPPKTHTAAIARLAIVAAITISGYLWWKVHQSWFMASDDYLAISRGGHPYGQFTAADWWHALATDWYQRNGRTSDSLLRLVLRPGQWFYPIFAPAMLTAAGIGIAILIRAKSSPQLDPWRWVAALSLIPSLLWLHPPIASDVILWTAGAMNYMLPFTLLLFCLIGFSRATNKISLVEAAGWSVLIVATQSIHESAGLALVGSAFFGLLMLRRHSEPLPLIIMCLAALVSFAFHMTSPGLWKRASAGAQEIDTVRQTLHFTALAATGLWDASTVLWPALAIILALLSMTSSLNQTSTIMLRISAASIGLFSFTVNIYHHRAPSQNGRYPAIFPEHLLPQMILVVCTMALMFAAVAIALFLIRKHIGNTAILTWAAFCGGSGFMLLAGMHDRAQFISLGLLGASTLTTGYATLSMQPYRTRFHYTPLVACILIIPSGLWFDRASIQLPQNKEYVNSKIIPALQEAASGNHQQVIIPTDFPHPVFEPTLSFDVRFFSEALKIYYSIPEDVDLHNY